MVVGAMVHIPETTHLQWLYRAERLRLQFQVTNAAALAEPVVQAEVEVIQPVMHGQMAVEACTAMVKVAVTRALAEYRLIVVASAAPMGYTVVRCSQMPPVDSAEAVVPLVTVLLRQTAVAAADTLAEADPRVARGLAAPAAITSPSVVQDSVVQDLGLNYAGDGWVNITFLHY